MIDWGVVGAGVGLFLWFLCFVALVVRIKHRATLAPVTRTLLSICGGLWVLSLVMAPMNYVAYRMAQREADTEERHGEERTAQVEIFLLDDSQVRGVLLGYGEHVYRVRTADGAVQEVPEANVREVRFVGPRPETGVRADGQAAEEQAAEGSPGETAGGPVDEPGSPGLPPGWHQEPVGRPSYGLILLLVFPFYLLGGLVSLVVVLVRGASLRPGTRIFLWTWVGSAIVLFVGFLVLILPRAMVGGP